MGVITLSNDGERGGMVLEAAKWAVVDDLVFGETEKRVNWNELYAMAPLLTLKTN